VHHPAPFPVELPARLIHLYTFRGDLVLDPFMGSGSSMVAAARLGRRYVGYDLDPQYVEIARKRVELETRALGDDEEEPSPAVARTNANANDETEAGEDDFQSRATREGKAAQALAEQLLTEAGFERIERNKRLRGTGVTVNFVAADHDGAPWYFDVSGAFTTTRGGLLRTDTVWKSLGRAHVLANNDINPVVFLTSHLPRRGSEGDVALRAAGTHAFFDAIEMRSNEGFERLRKYAAGGHHERPLAGFWSEQDLSAGA
jgi:site-specific DNA-methyltransferase (adenine-specific)